MSKSRRLFLTLALASALSVAMTRLLPTLPAANGAEKTLLKIGIIGSGNIGSTLGEFWIKAGHEVFFSSRHPEELKGLVERLGSKAHAGTTREAVKFGDVDSCFRALRRLARDWTRSRRRSSREDCP